MSRNELQRLAEDRIRDAHALLAAGRWSGAYHLAGYAVECGLKSCILHYLESGILFTDRTYLKALADCWTHDLMKLVEIAGLKAELNRDCGTNADFATYWSVAKDWNETSRYKEKNQAEAEELLEAITNDPNGVISWIRTRW